MRPATRKNQGFTLLEMSIVLVIIGLIIASVLVGKTLIRESQINSVMADAQRYITAANSFSTKYGALPGDMSNATTYWGFPVGANSGDTPPYSTSCGSLSSTGTQTCNGNGNGQVGDSGSYLYETFRFWQQMVDAQMIQGNFTGVAGSGAASTNAPQSRLSGSGFGVTYAGIKSSDTNYFDGNYGHVLIFGLYNSNTLPVGASLTGAEAESFDKKYDDGLPASGNVQTWKTSGYNANCATTSVSSTAVYNSTAVGTQCSMILLTGF